MKTLITLVLACFATAVIAQTNFVPATSLMNEFATASISEDLSYTAAAEEAAAPTLEEVEDHFNIRFATNPVFEDIHIVFDLASTTNVTIEVVRNGQSIFTANNTLGAGTQETVWDENISRGSGVHYIKVIANNKVETKKIRL